MKKPSIPNWLPFAILATALLSLVSIFFRYRMEQHNRAVSIAVEYENVESFAGAQGKTVEEGLQALKKQGLGSVVLSEEYVADLVNEGRVQIQDDTLIATNPIDQTRLMRAFAARFPGRPIQFVDQDGHATRGATRLPISGISAETLRATPVGLNPEEAETIKKAGLGIVARMANPPGVSAEYVRSTLIWAHELGASVFLPMGDQVLGRRDALKTLTNELGKLGMAYASPEFSKLGGDENVLRAAPAQVVRLHSAQAAELDKLPLDQAIERYSLAARERGMRILLVRPISFASPAPLGSLDGFVKAINDDCRRQGLDMGAARPFKDPGVPTILFLLIGLSIVPTAYFVGTVFVKDRRWQLGGLALASLIGLSAISNHGRPYAALLAAIVFPIAAFVLLDARKRHNVILDFVLVSLTSLVGGLAIAGLLNTLPYFVRAQQFEGVKLAVFLPIFVIALYFLMRGADLKELLKNPMTWGAALLALVVLAGLAFMSTRTGNDNPAGVSDFELRLRFLLDQILFVRPRTKEFMVGHPLLIIGITLLIAHKKKPSPQLAFWCALALAGGAIGQTDIVNTMCHIHTPVALSLMRIGVGMVAGCIIGLAVCAVGRRWLAVGET
ncbi:MAG TPA: DUF5693 family protein [Fimbriimonadaceae bacterium]|nr:DUF5693 family protein [Fimbriimonadaceae bacterium]